MSILLKDYVKGSMGRIADYKNKRCRFCILLENEQQKIKCIYHKRPKNTDATVKVW